MNVYLHDRQFGTMLHGSNRRESHAQIERYNSFYNKGHLFSFYSLDVVQPGTFSTQGFFIKMDLPMAKSDTNELSPAMPTVGTPVNLKVEPDSQFEGKMFLAIENDFAILVNRLQGKA